MSLAVLLGATAAGQSLYGHIRGTVVHPDGSVAAGVPLTIVNERTNETRRVLSDGDGRFAAVGLVPGTWRIETSKGFDPIATMRTELAPGQDLNLEIRLGLTSIDMEADLRPTFVPVDRQTATLRTRIDPLFIDTLPFDGRRFTDVVLLSAGTQAGTRTISSHGTDDPFTTFYVNSGYATEPRSGTPAASLSLDALDQVDVRTGTFDVSHGRSAGAQVVAIMKAGTNRVSAGATGLLRTSSARAQLGAFAGGPITADRTFLFGSYQFTQDSDQPFDADRGHLLSARADHVISGTARTVLQYALDDGRPFDRRGQIASASVQAPIGDSWTNEARVGLARVGFGNFADDLPIAESSTLHLSDIVTWAEAEHLVSAGIEWAGIEHGLNSGELAGTTWGLFVQDDWHAHPSISITAGARFDHVSPDGANASNAVSPRFGAALTVDRAAQTVVRGGYGVYRNVAAVNPVTPRLDGWSLSVQRQVGRARLLEAAYIGNRVDDLFGGFGTSRYDAMQLEFEQRSELGISALVGYTYGFWDEELGTADRRAPLDSRHRLSAGFVVSLPFGDERRWFDDGLAATILGDMELTGLFALQSGRPLPGDFDEQGPGERHLDLGLVKRIRIEDATLQLRAESFNVTNRQNLERGRRFQFGGGILF